MYEGFKDIRYKRNWKKRRKNSADICILFVLQMSV